MTCAAPRPRISSRRRSLLDDAPVIDDGDPIAQPFGFFHVVRGQHDRAARRRGSAAPAPTAGAATGDPARWWARRGTGCRARRPARRRSPAAAAVPPTACRPTRHASPQLDVGQQRVDRPRARGRSCERGQDLGHGQPFGQPRLLQRDADPLAQADVVARPGHAQQLDLPRRRCEEPLQDLDGGRLARAVRPQQAEALAAPDREVEAIDRHHRRAGSARGPAPAGVVRFPKPSARNRRP